MNLLNTIGPSVTMGVLSTGLVLVSSIGFAQEPPAPEPPKTWTGKAGAGLSMTGGNSDTVNYNVSFDLTRTPEARNVTKWNGLYLRGSQGNLVVANKTSLAFRDEYTLSGRTFVFAQVDYLRDTLTLIDYLVAPTAGVGYKVLDGTRAKFALDFGAGSVSEKNPGVDLRTSGAATAGATLQFQLTPTATLKHTATGLWKVDDLGDSLYTFSVGLATQISPRVQLSIELLDSFKNRPTSGATKNDTAFVATISSTF
jgi:putative salt-induced outer membrane protein YdiY